jgi:hypothetical protein
MEIRLKDTRSNVMTNRSKQASETLTRLLISRQACLCMGGKPLLGCNAPVSTG